ncbi:MAG: nicotinate-nucleotide adenylyltransferase [Prevotella sp.]|nr:nicotinate-nucleotide adenylyltransferase [Prevotella sp.]
MASTGHRRIGIFGGSFNPIHLGHTELARQIRTVAGLDEVWLVVSPQNPLKPVGSLLSDQLRYQMARIALHGESGIRAVSYEFNLPRPSYTWNTLQYLGSLFPDCEFSLIIGADNWCSFQNWRQADDIIANYDILVYPRQGYDVDAGNLPKRVALIQMPLYNVSSTMIRSRIQQGLGAKGLVAPAIEPLLKTLYT